MPELIDGAHYWFAAETAPGGALIALRWRGFWFIPGLAEAFDLNVAGLIGPVAPPPTTPPVVIN